jgi:hypothetical protein
LIADPDAVQKCEEEYSGIALAFPLLTFKFTGVRERLEAEAAAVLHTYNTMIKPAVIKAVPHGLGPFDDFAWKNILILHAAAKEEAAERKAK